jgi:D-glucosaminate-6-phosphate ammonia-lyase
MGYPYKSKVLSRLGVRSWINAANWSTVIGGTWIDDRVLDAMNEVAKTFVDMHELIAKVDERIAEICNVDEAHITTGTGAAMGLAVAGCMARNDYGKWMRLPNTDGMKNEVVNPRGHHIMYTPQWTVSGAALVEYGQAGTLGPMKRELECAITDRTCCLTYTASYNVVSRGMIPLKEVIDVGKAYDVPVVVDAASMLPPVANLHKYTDMGADIVCFSGGKAIKAPNNTGMMLGNGRGTEIIRAIRAHSFPNAGWGRGYKISKEQITGLLVALEIFVEEGDSLYAEQMETAEYLMKGLSDIPGLEACIIPNDESFHEHVFTPHVPRVLLRWDAKVLGLTGKDVDQAMAVEDPPIFLRNSKYYSYFTDEEWRQVDTYYLRDSEKEIVAERLRRILSGK